MCQAIGQIGYQQIANLRCFGKPTSLNTPDLFATCRISENTQAGVRMATKLEKLLQKEEQLKAQIQQAKAAERTLEKKRDTRRKILIGAAVMARVDNGEWPKADLEMMMDGFLTRPNERELFGLDAKADESDTDAQAKAKEAKLKAKAKAKVQRTEGKDEGTGEKKASRSTARLAEPDFDVDKEFNL